MAKFSEPYCNEIWTARLAAVKTEYPVTQGGDGAGVGWEEVGE